MNTEHSLEALPHSEDGSRHYENLAPSIWNPVGSTLAAAADLVPGERVLDLCSGTGSSALPAAQEVGPEGRVVAVDRSPHLLAIAREKARTLGLGNLETVAADIRGYEPDETPDAALLGLAVFLFEDPVQALSGIRGMLGDESRLVLSTWSKPGLEPVLEPFLKAAKRHNPGLSELDRPRAFRRIEHASDPAQMREDLNAAGFSRVDSSEISFRFGLDGDLLWDFVLGTDLRSMLSPADSAVNARIRSDYAEQILTDDVVNFTGTIDLHVARP
ncbi:class I SAM-dependent methyltransferase [Arthrobacter sp. UM1]|uniref:class I SAM-dependent methyltransferase n=1 Tax=Arthrobacter sp. UM1 TaxID=2766776 RepID=UPI001CF69B19|nr:methyltransferase domain-containing protein [Arthrobacter sp. UM1]MCB4207787.1 methyltransferase domain-containing protein [Arthrobacter sp. UM1]